MPDKELMLATKLPQAAGWTKMTQAAQGTLQKLTYDALHSYGDAERSAHRAFGDALRFCVKVAEVDRFLNEDKHMTLWIWAEKVFEGDSDKILRVKKHYDRLIENVQTDANILALADAGVPGMTDVAPGRFVTAVKALPAPKNAHERPKWIKQVQEKVRAGFSTIKKTDHPKLSREDAIRQSVLMVRRCCRLARIKDSAGRREVIEEVAGRSMSLLAVPGSVTVKPIKLEDDWLPKVGFPRGQKRTKRA